MGCRSAKIRYEHRRLSQNNFRFVQMIDMHAQTLAATASWPISARTNCECDTKVDRIEASDKSAAEFEHE